MRRWLIKGTVFVLLTMSFIALASDYWKIDTTLGVRVPLPVFVLGGPVVAWYQAVVATPDDVS